MNSTERKTPIETWNEWEWKNERFRRKSPDRCNSYLRNWQSGPVTYRSRDHVVPMGSPTSNGSWRLGLLSHDIASLLVIVWRITLTFCDNNKVSCGGHHNLSYGIHCICLKPKVIHLFLRLSYFFTRSHDSPCYRYLECVSQNLGRH